MTVISKNDHSTKTIADHLFSKKLHFMMNILIDGYLQYLDFKILTLK